MKEKKKSDLSLLLDFAGSYKGLTFLGLVCGNPRLFRSADVYASGGIPYSKQYP